MLKKISIVFIGYGFAQFILFISSPLISRFYDTKAFGKLGYILTFSSILLPLASLRFEYAIPLVKRDSSKVILLRLCQKVVVFTSFFSIIIFLLVNKLFINHHPTVLDTALFALILIAQGNVQILNLYCISHDQASQMTIGKIIQNISLVCSQVLLVLIFPSTGTLLLVALLLGQTSNLLYLFYLKNKHQHFADIAPRRLKKTTHFLIRRFMNLPLFMSWGDLINSLSSGLPVLFFGRYFGVHIVGLYFFSYRVFSAPISLLGLAVSQVMLKSFADNVLYKQAILAKFLRTSASLAFLGAIFYLLSLLVANYASQIFGAKWAEMSVVVKYIALPISFMLLASPLSTLLNTLNKNRVLLFWQCLYFFSSLTILYLYRHQSFLFVLHTLSWFTAMLYFFYWLLILWQVIKYEKKLTGLVKK